MVQDVPTLSPIPTKDDLAQHPMCRGATYSSSCKFLLDLLHAHNRLMQMDCGPTDIPADHCCDFLFGTVFQAYWCMFFLSLLPLATGLRLTFLQSTLMYLCITLET